MYTLTHTNYEDDYKHRYDSGVYPDTLGVYKTYQKAYSAQIESMKEVIQNYFNDLYDPDSYLIKYLKYFDIINDWYIVKETMDNDEVEELADNILRGEFVDYTDEWEIESLSYTD